VRISREAPPDRNAPLVRAVRLAPRHALALPDIDLALAVWRQRDREYALPALGDPVISLHVGGRGRVRYGNRDGWSRRSTTLGTVTFLPPGVPTRWRVEGGEVEHLTLTLGPASRLRALVEGAAPALEVGVPDALNVALAQALVRLLASAPIDAADLAYATSLCETLLRHFVRLHRAAFAPATHADLVARAIHAIETRYAEPLTVQALAAHVGLSSAHFSALFKRDTGRSPHQYLLQVRIERVRDALSTTRLPLGDIAQNFGFASQSHLNTAFRKWTGMTPTQYRARAED
jgi:AraC family transcriptional regulator